ncbi:asparaginase domain-containing protein [Paracoccus sp. 1_MG-2023]|uniref:asparaginase domain-containing protein n=1 Tax=unclassified Paracoccus (in: a-proteobacteria) TaxID=2688777 RepID=UPI001C0A0326|nr:MULTISPECIES: asparaginase domain-containing protein [unclassified Paracoccus (in: a-proteobacteria)]MBU2956207.1 asparaginase [Paracoccus sp. C2R09]MDO6667884.1 asparaginase domain-containing protein [Paracoccus sp. 1_MG-2023]
MRICIINTGGTITSLGDPLAPMPPADFAQAMRDLIEPAIRATIPGVTLHVDDSLRFPGSENGTLDSSGLVPRDWCRMARHLLRLQDDHDGFVILHGTDTMDYSGAALSMLLGDWDADGIATAALSKPVILTGSQVPIFRQTADGLFLNALSDALGNVAGAIRAATLRIPEVGLFFDGRLLRGNRALKVSSNDFAAFGSPHLPPLARGGIDIRRDALALPGPACPERALDPDRAIARLDRIESRIEAQQIVLLPAIPAGMPVLARMIDDALERGATGLIIEAFGEGNLPEGDGTLKAALSRAAQASVPVVLTSRAIGGAVGTLHYAAGTWITATGAILGGDITAVAALAKLTILQAAGLRGDALATAMRRALAGECRAADRFGATLAPGQSLQAADCDAELVNDPVTGPVLRRTGQVIWQAPGPGTLRLTDRLRLLSHDGRILWEGPHSAPGTIALLDAGGLRLVDPSGVADTITALPC